MVLILLVQAGYYASDAHVVIIFNGNAAVFAVSQLSVFFDNPAFPPDPHRIPSHNQQAYVPQLTYLHLQRYVPTWLVVSVSTYLSLSLHTCICMYIQAVQFVCTVHTGGVLKKEKERKAKFSVACACDQCRVWRLLEQKIATATTTHPYSPTCGPGSQAGVPHVR